MIILAGDIDKGIKGIAWTRSAFPNKPVVYVAGTRGRETKYKAHFNSVRAIDTPEISF